MKHVEIRIYYDDLKDEAKKDLCRLLQTTPHDENWDVVPLFVFERDIPDNKED
jgi:hypothetical protein